MHSLALAALLLSAGLLASAARATPLSDGFLASPAPVSVSHATTLRGVLKSDPQFSLISEIVENDKEFAKLLDGAGPLAFFAPNDDAIRWGRRGHHDHHHDHDHDSDPDHREFIHRALLYHTVAANVSAGSLKDGSMLDSELELESLGGKKQKIRICAWKSRDGKGEVYGDVEGTESGDQQVLGMHDQLLEPESSRAMHVLLNCRAPLRRTDISASNGALHELGGILFPPGPVTRHLAHHPAIFGILNLAIRRAELSGLFDNTKGITVFAPTNRAFLKVSLAFPRFQTPLTNPR